MFVIVGIVIVIGAIVGGYLMEHGNIRVLVQPAELLIIGGAALGTALIANHCTFLKKLSGDSPEYSAARNMERPNIWKA